MCLYIFAPGNTVQIDYASETATLVDGGREAVFDLLVTNHSEQPIERLHFIYPHRSPAGHPWRNQWFIADRTETFFQGEKSDFNQFYTSDDTSLLSVSHSALASQHFVTISMADPIDIVNTLGYKGIVSGHHTVKAYEPKPDICLTHREWRCITDLGWSVFTIIFERPLLASQPRWMRIETKTGMDRTNRMFPPERLARWLVNLLTDDFEIVGPRDILHRFTSAIKAASMRQVTSPAVQLSLLDLQSLSHKVLEIGVDAPDTKTVIEDWRLNIFTRHYRRVDQPSYWGDLLPCGGLKNRVRSKRGGVQDCYQWKAGGRNIRRPQSEGFFGVRFTAHKGSLFGILLPWISFALASAALLSRPDVRGVLRGWWRELW